MIYERKNIGDRLGSHRPLTVLAMDDEEFEEVTNSLESFDPDFQTSRTSLGYEYLVICWGENVNWLFEMYQVIGGDLMFHCGPVPSKEPVG